MTCWAGLSAWLTSAPERALLDVGDELTDDRDGDVGVEQGDPDLARNGVDVGLGQSTLAAKVLERRLEPVLQGVEHVETVSLDQVSRACQA